MVWNEPGKDKDPWNSTKRPPDLERIVKNLHRRFGWLFGGKQGGPHHFNINLLWWLLPVIIIAWLLSGIYRVAPGERGVNFVIGRYMQVVSPGLHWHLPWPIGHADIINGAEGRDYTRSYNRLLTNDGNIVTVDAVVSYHVVDMRDYLFNTAVAAGATDSADAGARALLGALADSAIRTAVAHSRLENILGTGQDAVEADASQGLNTLLKPYHAGIAVTRLAFQRVSLPESLSSSDADISAAQQDADQAKSAAQAYADRLMPQVKSEADAKIQAAEIYRTTLVNQAQADVTGFDAVLTAYRKAPALTRDMLYSQTMVELLGDANKVVVDARSGNVTVQLNQASRSPSASSSHPPAATSRPAGSASTAPSASSHMR